MSDIRGTVSGSHSDHTVRFYGLSTCVWCKRTRKLLEDEDVAFEYVYVDLLEGEERNAAIEEVKRWNPDGTFPTVVVDDKSTIAGFKPDDIREKLGL